MSDSLQHTPSGDIPARLRGIDPNRRGRPTVPKTLWQIWGEAERARKAFDEDPTRHIGFAPMPTPIEHVLQTIEAAHANPTPGVGITIHPKPRWAVMQEIEVAERRERRRR